jgi:hypothetical protein
LVEARAGTYTPYGTVGDALRQQLKSCRSGVKFESVPACEQAPKFDQILAISAPNADQPLADNSRTESADYCVLAWSTLDAGYWSTRDAGSQPMRLASPQLRACAIPCDRELLNFSGQSNYAKGIPDTQYVLRY